MSTKFIGALVLSARAIGHQRQGVRIRQPLKAQYGMTLIELMVGITIGLMVAAVAGGALMVSRGVSGTVSDASSINQQAAYAMRVIGLQLRQAGSLYLNPNSGNAASVNAAMAPVAFEKSARSTGSGNDFDLSNVNAQQIISGTATTLTVGFRRYADPVFTSASPVPLARNCVGGPSDSSTDQRVESVFRLDTATNEIECGGNTGSTPPTFQPIIDHVANFQVRYLVQSANAPGTLGNPTVQYVDATAVSNWGQVQAVEVCMVLYGTEPIDLPSGSSYTDCNGSTQVDMTTLTGPRARRMHLVYRNVFQLRSQGLLGSVL